MPFALFENASGYALFEISEMEELAAKSLEVESSMGDYSVFSKLCKLRSYQPFTTAENALENMMKVSDAQVHDDLKNFLAANLPKEKKNKSDGKKSEVRASGEWLGVSGGGIGAHIEELGLATCRSDSTVQVILRGIRVHFPQYVKPLAGGALEKAQLGLGHAYSRAHVKFNVHRQDNMIIQSIALLDQIDKDLNTVSMRVKEWYGWHFPELVKIVPDAYIYARLVKLIGPRSTLFGTAAAATDNDDDDNTAKGGVEAEMLEKLTEITMDEDQSKQILAAARLSMGFDISEIDVLSIRSFADRVVELAKYRKNLHEYLLGKMNVVAPNLGALIGETIAARLIAHAGSLTKLSKCPASTVQILGAEKALFRALKNKQGKTPKYGIIFNSSAISRAQAKNKGRISRYLANKCAIASRIDAFSDEPDALYGNKLKEQVEERLKFFETGDAPTKNVDAMLSVKKQRQKRAREEENGADDDDNDEDSKKKAKKAKKSSKKSKAQDEDDVEEVMDVSEEKSSKKKKKKKSSQEDD